MDIFDSDSDDGLSGWGAAGIILVLGFGAYLLWQAAYQRGAADVIRLDAPGCVVKTLDGRPLTTADLTQRKHVTLPKGATVAAACLSPL